MEFESLRSKLVSSIEPDITTSDNILSAVLVIVYNSADPSVIMTVKPQTMRHHAGQIAFPGGRLDSQDADLLETALRETYEELGVHIGRNEIAGQLDNVVTQSSGYEITPFIHITEKLAELSSNTEVDKILYAPLEDLLGTITTSADLGTVFLHDGYTVWGATARILENLGHKIGILD